MGADRSPWFRRWKVIGGGLLLFAADVWHFETICESLALFRNVDFNPPLPVLSEPPVTS